MSKRGIRLDCLFPAITLDHRSNPGLDPNYFKSCPAYDTFCGGTKGSLKLVFLCLLRPNVSLAPCAAAGTSHFSTFFPPFPCVLNAAKWFVEKQVPLTTRVDGTLALCLRIQNPCPCWIYYVQKKWKIAKCHLMYFQDQKDAYSKQTLVPEHYSDLKKYSGLIACFQCAFISCQNIWRLPECSDCPIWNLARKSSLTCSPVR